MYLDIFLLTIIINSIIWKDEQTTQNFFNEHIYIKRLIMFLQETFDIE